MLHSSETDTTSCMQIATTHVKQGKDTDPTYLITDFSHFQKAHNPFVKINWFIWFFFPCSSNINNLLYH